MEVDKKSRETNISKFKKIISEKIAKDIENSINLFSIEYATINETPYLLDNIYDTKTE